MTPLGVKKAESVSNVPSLLRGGLKLLKAKSRINIGGAASFLNVNVESSNHLNVLLNEGTDEGVTMLVVKLKLLEYPESPTALTALTCQ